MIIEINMNYRDVYILNDDDIEISIKLILNSEQSLIIADHISLGRFIMTMTRLM